MSLLSFVIPCYRSELTIQKVIHEIDQVVSQKKEYTYEIICVNDCSPDGVYNILVQEAARDKRIKVINLAKNAGKHSAVLAGFHYAEGDYIVNLDDDFQCPVYELWRLLAPVEKDECDIATANYKKKMQNSFKNFGSYVNNLTSAVMLGKPKDLRFENFSIMKRFVMDEIIRYDKPYPYLEGLMLRITRRISVVMMEERKRGDDRPTGFTFGKSLALWLNGFTAFSVKPLRMASFLGFVLSIFGFIIILIMVIRKLMHPESILAGWTSTIAVLLIIGGIQMIMLGLLGEYVGRIYLCISNTPQYVVKNTLNTERTRSSTTHRLRGGGLSVSGSADDFSSPTSLERRSAD